MKSRMSVACTGVVAVQFLMLLAGCGDSYPCGGVTGRRVLSGALSTRESEAQARERVVVDRTPARPDGGAIEAIADQTALSSPKVERTVSPWTAGSMTVELLLHEERRCDGPLSCVVLTSWQAPNVYIRWTLPEKPGTHDLRSLHADVCEIASAETITCSAIGGTLRVSAVVAPCADLSCGHLDATFTLAALDTKFAAGPAAWGDGSVFVDMYEVEATCHRTSLLRGFPVAPR